MVDEELDPFGGPLRHLQRMAPPWSSQRRTVCGRARIEFLMCQTCLSLHGHRMETPSRWDEEPAEVVADWAGRGTWRRTADADRIRDELRALALLVAAHREEFDALVEAAGTDELRERRQERRGRRR